MTESELKPCPFCGAKNELEIWGVGCDEGSKGEELWVVHCANCGCSMNGLDSKKEAIEAWNKRRNGGSNNSDAREDFMYIVYNELSDDADNNRANRIIDAADVYADSF